MRFKKRQLKVLTTIFIIVTIAIMLAILKNNQKDTKFSIKSASLVDQIKTCQNLEKKSQCFQQMAQSWVDNYTISQINQEIQTHEFEPEIYADCHQIMHYVGRSSYKKIGDLGKTLALGTNVCFEGFDHGAVEGYVIENGIDADDPNISNIIPKICGPDTNFEKRELFQQCNHGIGHAMMLLTNNNLPRSLKLCDYLNEPMNQSYCYSGVFMENSNSSTNKDHPSKFYKADDPFYPCTILDHKYQATCYELQSFKFYEYANLDWPKTFSMCQQVPQEFQDLCYKTQGSYQVGFSQDYKVMKENCELAPKNSINTCVAGTVGTIITRFGPNIQMATNYCSILGTENKNACYNQLGLSLTVWTTSKEDIQNWCAAIEEEIYKKICLNPKTT